MLTGGLLERHFESSRDFIDALAARGRLALAGGLIAVAAGGTLPAVLTTAAGDAAGAGLMLGGAVTAALGARLWRLSARAGTVLAPSPQHVRLTTAPPPTRSPRAVIITEEVQAVELRILFASFADTAVDSAPANLHGQLSSGAVIVLACGEGFAIARVAGGVEPAPVLEPASLPQPAASGLR